MGGAQSEVSTATTDVLMEAAEFDPISIRATARKLGLHSDSSYRFERGLDPQGVDWASRRACELILQLAGGELAAGVIDVGRPPVARTPVVLRLSQIERIGAKCSICLAICGMCSQILIPGTLVGIALNSPRIWLGESSLRSHMSVCDGPPGR